MRKLGAAGGNFFSSFAAPSVKKLLVLVFMCRNLLPNKGPAMMMAGMAMSIPYNSTLPVSARKALTKTTGPGWGGKKQCAVDSEAVVGTAMYKNGNVVLMANVITNGSKIIKAAL